MLGKGVNIIIHSTVNNWGAIPFFHMGLSHMEFIAYYNRSWAGCPIFSPKKELSENMAYVLTNFNSKKKKAEIKLYHTL